MSNNDVVVAWRNGHRASSGNMRTDGDKIFSYALCIGEWRPPRDKFLLNELVAFNYTAHDKVGRNGEVVPGIFYSQTTSHHQTLVQGAADYVADYIGGLA